MIYSVNCVIVDFALLGVPFECANGFDYFLSFVGPKRAQNVVKDLIAGVPTLAEKLGKPYILYLS